MSSIEQKIDQVVEEVKELKREVRELKKTLILDITKVEVWTDIRDAPDYMISSFGRVRRKRDGYMMKIHLDKNDYCCVRLGGRSGKIYYIHRLQARAFIPNPDNKPLVDHIDGDPQNNSIDNLRWCTRTENNRNRRMSGNNKAGLKGVHFEASTGRYKAQICLGNSKSKHLGRFDTAEEASAAYEAAAKEAFGEFYRAPE